MNIELTDIKTEFLKIQNKYVGKMLTKATIDNIYCEFDYLLNYFGLADLKWTLDINNNTITFIPIRAIDKYCILGILSI